MFRSIYREHIIKYCIAKALVFSPIIHNFPYFNWQFPPQEPQNRRKDQKVRFEMHFPPIRNSESNQICLFCSLIHPVSTCLCSISHGWKYVLEWREMSSRIYVLLFSGWTWRNTPRKWRSSGVSRCMRITVKWKLSPRAPWRIRPNFASTWRLSIFSMTIIMPSLRTGWRGSTCLKPLIAKQLRSLPSLGQWRWGRFTE